MFLSIVVPCRNEGERHRPSEVVETILRGSRATLADERYARFASDLARLDARRNIHESLKPAS